MSIEATCSLTYAPNFNFTCFKLISQVVPSPFPSKCVSMAGRPYPAQRPLRPRPHTENFQVWSPQYALIYITSLGRRYRALLPRQSATEKLRHSNHRVDALPLWPHTNIQEGHEEHCLPVCLYLYHFQVVSVAEPSNWTPLRPLKIVQSWVASRRARARAYSLGLFVLHVNTSCTWLLRDE